MATSRSIAHRVARYLERQGLLVRDAGNSYLTADGVDGVDGEGGTEHNLSFGVNWYSKTHWHFMGNLIKVKSLCLN